MKNKVLDFLIGTNLSADKLLNTTWLLFRLHTGLSIALFAGWPKMHAGISPDWFVKQVGEIGFTFPSPQLWASLAAWGEFAGGLMIAFGFLTRFAALQLAIQFFVIAFLWYEEPLPLIGMYFQHLYFWCYILITVAGGGNYSIDQLLRNGLLRSRRLSGSISLIIIALLAFTTHAAGQSGSPIVTESDFKMLEGSYKGTLTYLDYSSSERNAIEATIKIEKKRGHTVLMYDYPKEPGNGGRERLKISKRGTMLNGEVILSIEKMNEELMLVTSGSGFDNNQKAFIRHTYFFSNKKVQITKVVKYESADEYFVRNIFELEKQ